MDEVYIAMCYPYTFTDCNRMLGVVMSKPDTRLVACSDPKELKTVPTGHPA